MLMSFLRAGSSVVERSIAARMVAGSIPVSRLLLLSSLPAWSDVLRCWALNFEKWFHRTTLSHLLRLWLLSNGDCVNSAMRSRCIPSLCWFQWTSTDLDGPSGFRPVSCLSIRTIPKLIVSRCSFVKYPFSTAYVGLTWVALFHLK